MRYLRVYSGEDGASRFEDVELAGTLTRTVEGVPPLLVSGPFACSGIMFVEQPKNTSGWEAHAHLAPRKQWVIMVSGRAAITRTDGQCREVGPGDVILAEDTTGRGHLSTPLTADVRFEMIPFAL